MKIKTTFLKIALGGMALFILFVGLLVTMGALSSYFNHDLFLEQIIAYIALYIAAFLALAVIIFIYRMLRLIDKDQPFTTEALQIVSGVKKLIIGLFVALLGILPMFYYIADNGDAPGVMIIGLGIVSLPLAVAIFVATMEKLLMRVIQIKQENDLTV